MSEPGEQRCRAGEHCEDKAPLYDEQGAFLGSIGALVTAPERLCKACRAEVSYALAQLPGDMLELSALLAPSLMPKFSDPEMPSQPHVMTAPPAPIRLDILALQELIDHLATSWARSVALEHNLKFVARDRIRSRQRVRVGEACRLLRINLTQFLALEVQEHRARSLTARRADGHDPDTTTRYADDYWCNYDGADGALELLKLHRRAQRYASRHPGEKELTPCPHCERRTLVREHRNDKVVCTWQGCGARFSDDDFDAVKRAAFKAHGIEAR